MQQTCTSAGMPILPGLLMVLKMEMPKKSKHQLHISHLTSGSGLLWLKANNAKGIYGSLSRDAAKHRRNLILSSSSHSIHWEL